MSAEELKKQRSLIGMELLWVQQAIESRKQVSHCLLKSAWGIDGVVVRVLAFQLVCTGSSTCKLYDPGCSMQRKITKEFKLKSTKYLNGSIWLKFMWKNIYP